jgi:WD40 repeat protein
LNPETSTAIASLATGSDSVVHAVFSANGRDIVTWDATGVRVWDPATGRLRSSMLPRGRPVVAVPSPDAARIVSLSVGSDDPYTTIEQWDRTREEPVAAWRLDGRGEGAGFDASGRRVVAWSDEGVVAVWDVASRRRLATLSVPGVQRVALSPDGLRVATGAGDGTVQIWNVAGGREVKRLHHALRVVAVTFDADGSRLLAASADGTAKIWDARTDRDPVALRGHQTEITDASFDSTGRWVVTASLDGTARVWDGLTGQEIERFHHPAQVTAAMFDRDSRHVATVAGDFRARVFDCETCVPLDALVRLARSRLVTGPG